MPAGLSNPTSLALSGTRSPAWLEWWTAPRDAPVLVLLALVLLVFGLGLLARRGRSL